MKAIFNEWGKPILHLVIAGIVLYFIIEMIDKKRNNCGCGTGAGSPNNDTVISPSGVVTPSNGLTNG